MTLDYLGATYGYWLTAGSLLLTSLKAFLSYRKKLLLELRSLSLMLGFGSLSFLLAGLKKLPQLSSLFKPLAFLSALAAVIALSFLIWLTFGFRFERHRKWALLLTLSLGTLTAFSYGFERLDPIEARFELLTVIYLSSCAGLVMLALLASSILISLAFAPKLSLRYRLRGLLLGTGTLALMTSTAISAMFVLGNLGALVCFASSLIIAAAAFLA